MAKRKRESERRKAREASLAQRKREIAKQRRVFESLHGQLAASRQSIEARIRDAVSTCAEIVKRLHPVKLMHRCYWDVLGTRLDAVPEESRTTSQQVGATFRLNYLLRLIAAVQPAADTRETEIAEEDIARLQECTDLILNLTWQYGLARTSSKREHSSFDDSWGQLQIQTEMAWTAQSGDRYLVHQIPHLLELLEPHDEAMEATWGIPVQTFVQGAEKLLNALTFGVGDALDSLDRIREQVVVNAHLTVQMSADEQDDAMRHAIGELKADPQLRKLMEQAFGNALFDVAEVTGWPDALLLALSFAPGEDTAFLTGGTAGWATQPTLTRRKPFLRFDGRFYAFDQHAVFDHLYRSIESSLATSQYRRKWMERQAAQTERISLQLLSKLLPNAAVVHSPHYRVDRTDGVGGDRCECDGIVIYDDHLFIVEVKSGAFPLRSPTTQFRTHIDAIRDLLVKPAQQGARLLSELASNRRLVIESKDGRRLFTLLADRFREITICAITLDQLCDISPQVQFLPVCGWPQHLPSTWVVSLDDLRVISDVFANPLQFLQFVQIRKRAFRTTIVQTNDELDHVGMYLEHLWYDKRFEDMARKHGADHMTFPGYRDKLDHHFHARTHGEPSELRMPCEPLFQQIADCLARSDKAGRSEAAAWLLDTDGEMQTTLVQMLEHAASRQALVGRPLPITVSGRPMTFFIDSFGHETDRAWSVLYVASLKEHYDTDRWLVFWLSMVEARCVAVDHLWITASDVQRMDPEKLAAQIRARASTQDDLKQRSKLPRRTPP